MLWVLRRKLLEIFDPIIEESNKKNGKNIDFIFGHPMAGREKRGIDFADNRVFSKCKLYNY